MAHAEQVLLTGLSTGPRLHGADTGGPLPAWMLSLSERDVNVLQLLADGRGTAAIADDLAYSESTIKNVIRDLVRQMGARNRAHAVAMSIRAGVI